MFVFVFHFAKYISLGAFGSVVSVSCLESETGLARKSVRISMITGITTAPPIKVVVPLLGHYFILANSKLFFFVIMWDEWSTLLSDPNQSKDLIQESLVAENSFALLFPK